MSRFRIKNSDTIKATASSAKTRKLLCSLYDSGYTSIKQVERALIAKIPYFDGKKIDITITNLEKEQSKHYTINVN